MAPAQAGRDGGPSLRQKNGYAQDDKLDERTTPPNQKSIHKSSLLLTACTARVAVTFAILDRRSLWVDEYLSGKTFQPEVFHTTKKFVLVCRTVPAFNFCFSFLANASATQANSLVNLGLHQLHWAGNVLEQALSYQPPERRGEQFIYVSFRQQFIPESVVPHSGRAREKDQSPFLRHLVEAHQIQSLHWSDTFRACAYGRIPPRGR